MRIRPASHNQTPMPAKQCRRSDDKRAPARSRQQTARGSEENSIGRTQLGPSELATQHRELMAEHDDLELFELIRTEAQRRELQQALDHEVAERPEQRAAPPSGRGGQPPLRARTAPEGCQNSDSGLNLGFDTLHVDNGRASVLRTPGRLVAFESIRSAASVLRTFRREAQAAHTNLRRGRYAR